MEYLATGTPVVSTDINVLPEIIQNGRNGFIVPPEDPYAMAGAVLKILRDNNLQVNISKNNIDDFKSKFDIFRVAAKIAQIYQKLIINLSKS